jgi:hypothetical protein
MSQPQLFWHDAASYDQEVFAAAGLANFADFWNLESHPPTDAELTPMRQHLHRRRGVILRQTVRIRLNRCEYFLKRAGGPAYPCIVNEHRAVGKVADFGLTPPRLVAWGFDETEWRGMLLFKRLPGYYSLQDLLEFKAPPEVVADFQTHKKDVLKRVTRVIRRVQDAGYFYLDWHSKHIFVRRGGDDIVLIDLERFRPLRDCPWYYRLFFVRYFVRRREWATLRRALGSSLYTPRYLLGLFEK